ncbi:MAG: intradiol ring-cleavage dioxygenase [Geodermatophilales bacterium]|nr:intradiol ring-cleavage dioxygenase [Geodermatophilales bacterium]
MTAHEHEAHDRGLLFDMDRLVGRRRALALFGGTALAALAGCSTGGGTTAAAGSSSSSAGSSSSTGATVATDVDVIPEETAGPYPADGSNGKNVLSASGIVRSDIRSSFGSSTTTAEGVPLTVRLTLVRADGDTPVEGAAVYLWHCNRDGAYSMYDRSVADENYLRGVQTSAADGTVTFTSIFPACYAGRWPHVHFEVYKSLDEATAAGQILATSQLALPGDVCSTVYATTGYEQSVSNLSRVSLTRDMVFGDDGGVSQLATMTGSVSGGYTAALTVGL